MLQNVVEFEVLGMLLSPSAPPASCCGVPRRPLERRAALGSREPDRPPLRFSPTLTSHGSGHAAVPAEAAGALALSLGLEI